MANIGEELDGNSDEGSSLDLESPGGPGENESLGNTETSPENQGSETAAASDSNPDEEETSDKKLSKKWVDYIPTYEHRYAKTVRGRMEEHLANINDCLAVKEEFNLAFIDQRIHRSYYRMWVHDSNQIFRCAVRLKHRIAKLPKTK